mmetsp:Transcript_27240/g.47380  ORF Transcript_27240/g.47380 Transcript_27240/m.47380 type:complete len:271 (-) Transcript_27240:832-1644(-)
MMRRDAEKGRVAPTEKLSIKHWVIEEASPEDLERVVTRAEILGLDVNEKRPIKYIHPYQALALFNTPEDSKSAIQDEMVNTGVVAALFLTMIVPYLLEPAVDNSSHAFRLYMYSALLASAVLILTVCLCLLVLFQLNHMVDEEDVLWYISRMMATKLRKKEDYYETTCLQFLRVKTISASDFSQFLITVGMVMFSVQILAYLGDALEDDVDFWVILVLSIASAIPACILVKRIDIEKHGKIVENYNQFVEAFHQSKNSSITTTPPAGPPK